MNRAIWIIKKNQLCLLVKKISDAYGGDDIEWLKEYCRELINNSPDDKIDDTLKCFQSMYVPRRTEGSKDAAKETIWETTDTRSTKSNYCAE
jgi:hypothetical protein